MKALLASEKESPIDIIERAGIKTIQVETKYSFVVYLEYEGKRIVRPWAHRFEEVIEEEFGIKIVYVK